MGHVTVCAIRFVSGKGSPPWVSERAPFGETVHPGLGVGGVQMAIQPLKLAHEPSPETKQKQKLLSQLEESHPRRGSPHWDRLSFEQVLMSSPPCGEQEGSEGGNGTLVDPTELAGLLPALGHERGVPEFILKGRARLRCLIFRKTLRTG